MANWSGTYTITSGTTGTLTSATINTATNTGASWPTGAQSLANFTIRILTGTGAGQERVVSSNTATVITTTTNWTTTPDATSTYEIVAIFKNNDHFTAATTFSTNTIVEAENSATIYTDGSFIVTFATSCRIRMAKSVSTLVTWDVNSPLTVGRQGAWQYLAFSTTSIQPEFSFHKIRNASHPFVLTWHSSMDGMTWFHHIWADNTQNGGSLSGTITQPVYFRNFFYENGNGNFPANTGGVGGTYFEMKDSWFDQTCTAGRPPVSQAGLDLQVLKNFVTFGWQNNTSNLNSGKTVRIQDSYITSIRVDGIVLGNSSNADAGTREARRNVYQGNRLMYSIVAVAGSTGVATSTFNDCINRLSRNNQQRCFDISNAIAYATSSSNYDYIAGYNLAAVDNPDTSNSTSSTATPSQYQNLTTARTNAMANRNRPLVSDNVGVTNITSTSVLCMFDSQNGSTISSTVNVDTSAGATILPVVGTTGFEVGEILEIGYGTARFEEREVFAISASTITFTSGISYTHTAAQADVVKKQLRMMTMPFVEYGLTSGMYSMRTDMPQREEWGLYFTGFRTTYAGITYQWKMYAHQVQLQSLRAGTTYYARAVGMSPLGERVESSEFNFTTLSNKIASFSAG